MKAFVTVGSTRFDALVHRVLDPEALAALRKQGYRTLVVQTGNSVTTPLPPLIGDAPQIVQLEGLQVEYWKFRPSLEDEYSKADLIISHAGSGTILDALRMGKPMIVVPNPTLLHNHQQELADELAKERYLVSSTIRGLPDAISQFDKASLVSFPPYEGAKFAGILDETMGYEAKPR